jgi:hypothetical protein
MPFGVELPEDLGSKTEVSGETAEQKDLETKSSPEDTKDDVLDLDKLEKFRFDGREWSAKDLKNAYLMQSDYTRKTQEIAKERQYVENFSYDLDAVIKNPSLLDKMREVYPRKYVEHAERVLSSVGKSNQSSSEPGTKEDPKLLSELSSIKSDISEWKEAQRQAELKSITSWLDNQYDSLSKKFPYANQDAVTMRAQYLNEQGTKITEKVLEKLFETNNSEVKSLMDRMYKDTAKKQIEVNGKAKDVGAGGGVPGGAPRGFKTIKEATNAFLSDIEAGRKSR